MEKILLNMDKILLSFSNSLIFVIPSRHSVGVLESSWVEGQGTSTLWDEKKRKKSRS